MTPEREAEIRECIRTKALVPAGHAGDALTEVARLRAEIDRLRALPVLATCGQCGHRSSSLCDHPEARGDEDRSGTITRVSYRVESAAAPPAWCPLRGGR